ncbi:MAG: hypothetical protein E7289_07960 [Lachnospiraceae bacterium]|nr:hypothetical protein [Lachnospiraceae bacterium]
MKKKGSFTIEAAIVVPFLLLIMLLLIHISFFLYNREAATVIASRAVLKGVQMEQEGKADIKNEIASFLEEETSAHLIFTQSVRWDVSVTLTKVKVKLYLIQDMPFKKLSCEIAEEMNRLNPVSVLWEKERFQKAK